MDSETAFNQSQSQPSDVDLLDRLRAGQVSALSVIYDRYSRLVYGLAYRILQNAEEAEDLTQEVFLTVWQRDTYNPQRGSFSSFIALLTRSRAIDRIRARGTKLRFLQRWQGIVSSESVLNPVDNASMEERSQRIREALVLLSDKEREVLEIAYYEGLSQSEIAQRLNVPLGTVKTRSRQGLLKLRQTLEGYV
jgi:RNA polymerase sigma-70 factor, ECF subfamily